MYMCILHIYIYISVYSVYIYKARLIYFMYIYIYTYIFVYTYIYIYTTLYAIYSLWIMILWSAARILQALSLCASIGTIGVLMCCPQLRLQQSRLKFSVTATAMGSEARTSCESSPGITLFWEFSPLEMLVVKTILRWFLPKRHV